MVAICPFPPCTQPRFGVKRKAWPSASAELTCPARSQAKSTRIDPAIENKKEARVLLEIGEQCTSPDLTFIRNRVEPTKVANEGFGRSGDSPTCSLHVGSFCIPNFRKGPPILGHDTAENRKLPLSAEATWWINKTCGVALHAHCVRIPSNCRSTVKKSKEYFNF